MKRKPPGKERGASADNDPRQLGSLASLKEIGSAVWNYAFRRTGDSDVADDTEQAVTLQVHVTRKTKATYAGDRAKVGAFATRATANELNRALRNKRTRDEAAPHVAERQAVYLTARDDPEQRLFRQDFRTFVMRALAALQEEDRIVWYMARVLEMSSAEIAEARESTTGAIDARLSRAGDKMLAYFESHGIHHPWEMLS